MYIPSVVDALIAGGQARVKVLQTHDTWFGVTYREDRDIGDEVHPQADRGRRLPGKALGVAMQHDLNHIAKQFRLSGEPVEITPLTTGHINDTFILTAQENGRATRYILQRINHAVFKEPVPTMDNILRVTEHIRNKTTSERSGISRSPVDGLQHARRPRLLPGRSRKCLAGVQLRRGRGHARYPGIHGAGLRGGPHVRLVPEDADRPSGPPAARDDPRLSRHAPPPAGLP